MPSSLSSSAKPINIILDLDATVICSLRPWEKQASGLKGYDMDNEFIVYERPGLQEFLDFLFKNFNVAVWTAASKEYALFIVDEILLQDKPERKMEFVLFDYHGELSDQFSDCPKDLDLVYRIFPSFTSKNTIIIDDYEAVYMPQMCNSYPIPPFKAELPNAADDRELENLQRKLKLITPGECVNDQLITESTLHKALQKAQIELND